MAHLDEIIPYINSPTRFALAMLAVVLVWILFDSGKSKAT
jgi:hypothetical protein